MGSMLPKLKNRILKKRKRLLKILSELVRNGLARVVLYEKRTKIKYQVELLTAEKIAKEIKLGVWKK
ncbi:hypothetical protein COS77_04380 [Candidatus Roizmanbacteria bacterium CG06_land_8_20_14_3_00_34_14]|uniref:TNase-like domain-containing protein n=2 Tax=Candidatus Roizmaniibacteriota TaxID=1752723 RepID=A0A2M7ATH7_9BACT|nr:MAG: hypothetical protein COT02_04300 [Candidatus Roizmanbacteria bacterium CG07_land_8_20_14_0_80_34_15]PIU73898.1 MAG: hypothetical protein COS77_04380 [Candidatus Roizmanbacteria bacterium CG06_land_8_20_14_3_00_34_14]